MDIASVLVCVFSFNRGHELSFCLDSIQQFLPHARVLVFDDCSTKALTQDTLLNHKIISGVCFNGSDVGRCNKVGGLHQSKNFALEAAKILGFKYALFLQDDEVLIRKISTEIACLYEEIFNMDSRIVEIRCHTMPWPRERLRVLDPERTYVDHEKVGVMGRGILHVGRLIGRGCDFTNRAAIKDTSSITNDMLSCIPHLPVYAKQAFPWLYSFGHQRRYGNWLLHDRPVILQAPEYKSQNADPLYYLDERNNRVACGWRERLAFRFYPRQLVYGGGGSSFPKAVIKRVLKISKMA